MISEIDSYEGTFCDLEEPGYYSIDKEDEEYIKIPILDIHERVMHCHFEVLKNDYTQEEIEELVYVVLLHRFCDDYYSGKADYVRFFNIKTKEEWQMVYI